MIEKTIKSETATLAKEKGFNIRETYHRVFINSRNPIEPHRKKGKYLYKTKDECDESYSNNLYHTESGSPTSIGFPHKTELFKILTTQTELQNILRKNHNINIRIASNSLTYHFPVIEILQEDGTQSNGPKEFIVYNNYEDALEKGLIEALKLL